MYKQSIKIGCMLIPKDEVHLVKRYEEEFDALLDLCKEYGALLDLADHDGVFVLNTTRSCRKAIRRLYGSTVQAFRSGKMVELGGFK